MLDALLFSTLLLQKVKAEHKGHKENTARRTQRRNQFNKLKQALKMIAKNSYNNFFVYLV